MNKELAHTVSDILFELSQKLGVGAEHVYETIVRQVIISAYTGFIYSFFLLSFSIGSLFCLKWAIKEDETEIGGISGIIALGTLFLFAFITAENIKELANPEYYAMKEISQLVRGY